MPVRARHAALILLPLAVLAGTATFATIATRRGAEEADSAASVAAKPELAPLPTMSAAGDGGVTGAFVVGGGSAARRFDETAIASSPAPPPVAKPQFPSSVAMPPESPMLIRRGSASIQVDTLPLGIAAVRTLAARTGALVANMAVDAGQRQFATATLELRVPAARFDELVNGLAPLGRVETVQVQVQDVGEEYTDVAARVANARRLEQRLVELLANRTGRLADVLAVERELARVREEIERYEGRLRYLRTNVAYSSLAVTIHEPLPVVAGPPGQNPIARAFREAWRIFVQVIAVLIASLGVLVPVGVLGAGAWVLVRRWRRSGLTV